MNNDEFQNWSIDDHKSELPRFEPQVAYACPPPPPPDGPDDINPIPDWVEEYKEDIFNNMLYVVYNDGPLPLPVDYVIFESTIPGVFKKIETIPGLEDIIAKARQTEQPDDVLKYGNSYMTVSPCNDLSKYTDTVLLKVGDKVEISPFIQDENGNDQFDNNKNTFASGYTGVKDMNVGNKYYPAIENDKSMFK